MCVTEICWDLWQGNILGTSLGIIQAATSSPNCFGSSSWLSLHVRHRHNLLTIYLMFYRLSNNKSLTGKIQQYLQVISILLLFFSVIFRDTKWFLFVCFVLETESSLFKNKIFFVFCIFLFCCCIFFYQLVHGTTQNTLFFP